MSVNKWIELCNCDFFTVQVVHVKTWKMIRISFSTMRWSIFYRIWSHSRKKASNPPSSARWRRVQGCPPKQSLRYEVFSAQLTFCFLVHHFFKAGRTISITLFISCLPTIVIISWMASSYEHPPSQPAHLYSLPSLLCRGLQNIFLLNF